MLKASKETRLSLSITVSASSVSTTPTNSREVEVVLDGVDLGEIVKAIGEDDLLEHIGRDAAIRYHDITEAKEDD